MYISPGRIRNVLGCLRLGGPRIGSTAASPCWALRSCFVGFLAFLLSCFPPHHEEGCPPVVFFVVVLPLFVLPCSPCYMLAAPLSLFPSSCTLCYFVHFCISSVLYFLFLLFCICVFSNCHKVKFLGMIKNISSRVEVIEGRRS